MNLDFDARTPAQKERDESIMRSANRIAMQRAIAALAAVPKHQRELYVDDLIGRMRRAYRHGLGRALPS